MTETVNYYQIDFLRLFRLCVKEGIINKKRKMPINYIGDNKVDFKSISTCKRLFGLLLNNIFKGYTINNKKLEYVVKISEDMRNAFSYLNLVSTTIVAETTTQKRIDILQRYLNLKNGIRDNIFLTNNCDIKINLTNKNYFSPMSNSSITTNKPLVNFYHCALSCLEFREIWERDKILISQFVIDDKKYFKDKKIIPKVENKDTSISSKLSSQLAFNNALQQYRRSSNDADTTSE